MLAKVSPLKRQDWLAAAIFLAPNMIGLIVFILIPVVAGLLISFTEWDLLSPPEFVGLQNYADLLTDDPLFWHTLKNTVLYSLMVIPGGMIISLGLALALNGKLKGTALYRTIYFLPYVCSGISIALIWRWIYQPDFGLLNSILTTAGLPRYGWLTDRNMALFSVAIVAIWQSMGYNMVIFLAGLKGIPSMYYEAAQIDGASPWQVFRRITLPLLTPTLFFVLTISLIASFQVFAFVFVMTEGGPGDATQVYVYYLWENAFTYFKMGYASAMAYILFIIMLVITLLQVRLLGRRVHYDVA
jgi:multiple sugar transport system permease protein